MDWTIERDAAGMPVRLWWTPGLSEAIRKEREERERKARGRVYPAARAWAFKRGLCDADGYLLPPKDEKDD